MIALIRRLLNFSGNQKINLIMSFIYRLIDSFFEMMPILAILTVLNGVFGSLNGQAMSSSIVWQSLGIMVISIAGRIIFNNFSTIKRTLGSFDMCGEKRLEIGEKLKRAPMGYFDKNCIGEITAATTTTLSDIELIAVTMLEGVAGGFIHALVIGIWLLVYEWHIGLLMFLGLVVSMSIYSLMQKSAKSLMPRRQAAQANLVTSVLEYIQGMAVVKAFGLGNKTNKDVDKSIEESAQSNIILEKTFSSLSAVYQSIFKFAKALVIIIAPYLMLGGEINLQKCLLLLVSSFMIYTGVELVGSMASVARVVDASLDRMESVFDVPVLDENGKDIKLDNFDICVKDISFSYGDSLDSKKVIKNLSFDVLQNTTCAIVGPSGSGKSTLLRLIARFWDVQDGIITIGGHNICDFSFESLIKNFSIVFQNVYLFNDTIENNIKFGRPNATQEEIIEVAKKACCHEFIEKLPNGYQTMIGEGGSSLSGGEKQRISIARAILKDAPIVILDEATASVDPENEMELQNAINELTKDKTLLMIAHRLSTVRTAQQIIVLDDGKIVQKGTHSTLIKKEGLYKKFIQLRELAIDWEL